MEAIEYDDEFGLGDGPEPLDVENACCVECGRDWRGPRANVCPPCRSAGGNPGACFQCGCRMGWNSDGKAECNGRGGCDAQYPLDAVRTYRLGKLVERLVLESRSGSAEEVGRMIPIAKRLAAQIQEARP